MHLPKESISLPKSEVYVDLKQNKIKLRFICLCVMLILKLIKRPGLH